MLESDLAWEQKFQNHHSYDRLEEPSEMPLIRNNKKLVLQKCKKEVGFLIY